MVADNLLATLKEWEQTAYIHFTGGEPLLKAELFSLLEYLDQHPLIDELGIITNGILFNQNILKRLSTFPKLKKIKLSLDGGNAETNNSIRGEKTFEKIIEKIPLIKQINGFEVIFMFTVMKRNFRELPGLIKLSQDLGVNGVIIERFIPWGRGKERKEEVLTREEWMEMLQMLSAFFSIEDENSFYPYQAFQVSFNEGEIELLGAPCVIGVDGLCVMPNGDVFPCRRFPISIGNLLETPLAYIWNESEVLKKIRRKENLKGKCAICNIPDCRGCRSLAFALTGDYLAEDPICRYFK